MTKQLFCCLFLALPLMAQQRVQSIGTPTAVVRYQRLHAAVSTVATVAADPATLTAVTARFDGWIEKVQAETPYQRVTRGETLCTLYSPTIFAAEQDYLFAAQNDAALAASSVTGVASGAASLLADARARLEQLQVPAAEIARLVRSHHAQKLFPIAAPEDGIVLKRQAFPGIRVGTGTQLYTLEALQPIWIYAQVQDNDLGQIHIGQAASIRLDAYPGRQFSTGVNFIEPQVDPSSRTARVRFVLPNRDLALTPGMYGTAVIDVPLGRQLIVPASAILQSGTGALAFVAEGAGQFDPRPVQIGRQVGGQIVIRKGLHAGERVATGASFLIASQAQLSAAAGSYAPPPPGVSAAAAQPGTATMALTTDPSPARKGRNIFRVFLRQANGQPITGAQVTVTLSMPAMPAMGMAAMNLPVALHARGGGRYSGSGTLASVGTWQVEIVARKNGQVIAQTHTSLLAGAGQ